jgi:hypothetical protein
MKDAEISRKLDDAVIDAIVTDSKEILSRQRLIIRELYKRISAAIQAGDVDANLSGIIALMRYEAEVGGAIKPAGAGLSLSVVLQSLPSETRGAIHRALREYRDKSRGGIPGDIRSLDGRGARNN